MAFVGRPRRGVETGKGVGLAMPSKNAAMSMAEHRCRSPALRIGMGNVPRCLADFAAVSEGYLSTAAASSNESATPNFSIK